MLFDLLHCLHGYFLDTVGMKDFDLVDIKQLIASSGAPDTDSSHDIPHVIVQHETSFYQVMSTLYNEFHRVLYSSQARIIIV